MPDEIITMTREQLQGERDTWYENGLRDGRIRTVNELLGEFDAVHENVENALSGMSAAMYLVRNRK